jgi:hypothetical protein
MQRYNKLGNFKAGLLVENKAPQSLHDDANKNKVTTI